MRRRAVSYSINASLLQQVYGGTLKSKNRAGADTIIRIPTQPSGWPRRGSEAYGLKTELEVSRANGIIQTIPAFLKIFMTDLDERAERTRLLIGMQLAGTSEYYFGVPFGWLGHTIIN